MNQQVLVIDFEPHSLQATSRMLEEQGFDVLRAPSLADIDQIVEQAASVPGLIVLEPMLPGLDGFKLCRTLKGLKQDGIAPKVLVGSKIFQGARYRSMARDAGADFFYKKPSENDLLIQALNRFVGADARPPESGPPEFPSDPSTITDSREHRPTEDSVFDAIGGLDIDEALSRVMDSPRSQDTAAATHDGTEAIPVQVGIPSPSTSASCQVADKQPLMTRAGLAEDSNEDSPLDLAFTNLGEGWTGASASGPPALDDDPLSLGSTLSLPSSVDGRSPVPEGISPTGSATDTHDEGLPGPASSGPSSTGTDSEERQLVGEQVLDELLETALTGSSASEIKREPSNSVDARLEEIFSGSLSTPTESTAEAAKTEVPQTLAGMDTGTAELLSSLEELEHSIPQRSFHDDDGASSAFPTGDIPVDIETSVPLKPPPPSPEQLSLSQLLSESSPSVPLDSEKILTEIATPAAPSAADQLPESEPSTPPEASANNAASNRRAPMLLASILAIVVVAGVLGAWLMMRDSITQVESPPMMHDLSTQVESPPSHATLSGTSAAARIGEETGPETDAADPLEMAAESSPGVNPAAEEAPGSLEAGADPIPPGISSGLPELIAKTEAKLVQAQRDQARAAATQDDVFAAIEALNPEPPAPRLELGPADPSSAPPAIDTNHLIGTPENPPKLAPQIAGLNGISPPRLIPSSRVAPKYPPLALRLGLTGKVVLQAVVLRDGSVGSIEVLSEPEGHRGFGEAAREALKQWTYEPAMKNGYPVDTYASVAITFSH